MQTHSLSSRILKKELGRSRVSISAPSFKSLMSSLNSIMSSFPLSFLRSYLNFGFTSLFRDRKSFGASVSFQSSFRALFCLLLLRDSLSLLRFANILYYSIKQFSCFMSIVYVHFFHYSGPWCHLVLVSMVNPSHAQARPYNSPKSFSVS